MMNGYLKYLSPSEYQAQAQYAQQTAAQLFIKTMLKGEVQRLVDRILRRDNRLLNLDWLRRTCGVKSSHYVGIRSVPVSQIRGSEGRVFDFDASFRPRGLHIRTRWESVARAFLMNKPLPPVDLIQVGDTYFIRDGHHRVSVASALGQESLDAVVIELTLRS